MKNQEINLDEINSLDEAKRQITILLDSEKSIYYFIYLLCNYEIREPLLAVKGYAELIQQGKFIGENPFFLKRLLYAEHKIHKLIDVISRTAIIEKTGGIKYFQGRKEKYYQPVAIDLKSFLAHSVSEIEKIVDYQNDLLNHSIKFAKEHSQTISEKSPVQAQSNILEDLPSVQFEAEILEEIVSDVIFFITQDEISILNLSLTTEFDEHAVRIVFGSLTSSSITDRFLDGFSQFESAPTIFQIESPSILLYRSWCWLKAYNGDLLLDIQNRAKNIALVSVTICLQR
jgi:hypothetical protein